MVALHVGEDGFQTVLDLPALCHVTALGRSQHRYVLGRQRIGEARDPTVAATLEVVHRQQVAARHDGQIIAVPVMQHLNASQITAGLLDTHNQRIPRQQVQ